MSTQSITYPINLTTAEFSYLLSLVSATKVLGLDHGRFFPQTPHEKKMLWRQGQQELLQNGWLTPYPTGQYHLQTDLLQLVATIAGALDLTVTRKPQINGPTQAIYHYWSRKMVIELSQQESGVTLLPLNRSESIWAIRIRQALNLPAPEHQADHPIVLSQQHFRQLKENPQLDLMAQNDITADLARDFRETLIDQPASATIAHLNIDQTGLDTPDQVTALFWNQNHLWKVTPTNGMLHFTQTEPAELQAFAA